MAVDTIANALGSLKNCDNASKRECVCRPASKLLGQILRILQEHGYISTFEYIDDNKGGVYRIELVGKINECSAIKPRHAVKKDEFEKFEKRYLPSKDIGLLVVSTPKGIMTHRQAIDRNIGGRLLALIY